jgi:tetratricopeptide (TPR) repeat protein
VTAALQLRLDRGSVLVKTGRYELALAEALAALAEDPENARAHMMASWCHLHLGRPEEAERSAREAVRASPLALSYLAEALLALGRDREALEAMEALIAIHANDAVLHLQHAHVLKRTGSSTQALAALQRALAIDPVNPTALAMRGELLESKQDDGSAREVAAMLLRADAENPDGHALRGWLALREKLLPEAEQSFHEALRVDPFHESASSGLVTLHKLQHPLLRWLKPGWRGLRGFDAPARVIEVRINKRTLFLFKILLFPCLVATRWLLTNWGMPFWLALPAHMAAGALVAIVAAFLLTLASIVIGTLTVGLTGGIAFVLHAIFVETFGDLVLALGRKGRRILPRRRLFLAAFAWSVVLVTVGLVGALMRVGLAQEARCCLAMILCVLTFLGSWRGDTWRVHLGGLSCALLLAVGVMAGSWRWCGAGVLLVVGFAATVQMAATNTIVQSRVPDELRGRIMAVYATMFMGVQPIGSLLAGYVARRFGAPLTLAVFGFLVVIGSLVFLVRIVLRLPTRSTAPVAPATIPSE